MSKNFSGITLRYLDTQDSSDTCCVHQVGYILTIGVVSRARRRGTAAALLQRMLAELRGRGCRACYLHVITYNQAAQQFYLSQGFTQQARLGSFYFIR